MLDELRALERRPRAVVALDDIPPLEVVDQPFERTETIDAVWRAVEGLTVDLKMALLLRDVVGLSYTEIARLARDHARDRQVADLQGARGSRDRARPGRASRRALRRRRGPPGRRRRRLALARGLLAVGADAVRTMQRCRRRDPVRSLDDALARPRRRPRRARAPVRRPARRLRDERRPAARGQRAAAAARGRRRSSRERSASLDGVAAVEVAGPGFLNLTVDDAWLGAALAAVLDAGGASAAARRRRPERIQVELVSANPTGPITVASARNGAYGDAVARLLEFAGHDVEREYYYNDAGAQMDRFRESVEARPPRRGAARGRLPRRVRRGARPRARATRCRGCSSRSRRRSSGSASTSTASSGRASSRPRSPRRSQRSRPTRRTARYGRGRARTATTRTASSSARTASRPTSRPTPPTSGASSRAGSTG